MTSFFCPVTAVMTMSAVTRITTASTAMSGAIRR